MSLRPSYQSFWASPICTPVEGMNCHIPEAALGERARGL